MTDASRTDNRQRQMLGELHAHLRARSRRKRAARAVLASTIGALALAAGLYMALPPSRSVPVPHLADFGAAKPTQVVDHSPIPVPVAANASGFVPPSPLRVTVRIVRSEPLPTTPCDIAPVATLCILSDDQLIAALAEAGQPSGLIRTGGEAFIVPHQREDQNPILR